MEYAFVLDSQKRVKRLARLKQTIPMINDLELGIRRLWNWREILLPFVFPKFKLAYDQLRIVLNDSFII